MNSESKKLYSFMRATQGDWRNAVYITCSSCLYSEQDCCGHLLSANRNGVPILFPLPLFEKLTGETVEKDECAGVLTLHAFESLYHMWLIWNTEAKNHCSIMQILQNTKLSDMHT